MLRIRAGFRAVKASFDCRCVLQIGIVLICRSSLGKALLCQGRAVYLDFGADTLEFADVIAKI
ncbi:hypothetical protein DIE22_23855 [Burkholderia sp. Bp9142]|nr:hypothetical protein DIE22_23855 [Burkholderia sp. Bp9142]